MDAFRHHLNGRNSMQRSLLSYLLLIALASIWGASFLFIKIALQTIPPVSIAAGRIALAAVFLYGVMRYQGLLLPARGKHWFSIIAVALLGNVLPFTLISFGERHIDSSLASMFMATIPFFTILMANFMTQDEHLTVAKFSGVSIGLAGVVALFGPKALLGLGTEVVAQLLVIFGAISYAISGIVSRNLREIPKLQTAASILLVASITIIPIALVNDQPWTLRPDTKSLFAIGVLGLLSTAAAQLLILKIIQLRDASFLSLNNYLVPVFGIFWGMLVLSERPGPDAGIAFVIILVGLFVSQSRFPQFSKST